MNISRRFALVALLIVSGLSFLSAQDMDVFRVGLKAAPTFAFGSGAGAVDMINTRVGVGFSGGISAELVPIDNVSVEFDLLLSWFDYGLEAGLPAQTLWLRYAAIEFPLLLKGRLPLEFGTLTLGAGPNLTILAGDVTYYLEGSELTQPADKILHLSFLSSVGYEFPLSEGTASAELRYLRNFSSPLNLAELQIHANRFDVMLGYSISF